MNSKQLIEKIKEIQRGITKIKNEYISEGNLILDYITIFSHSDKEFEELIEIAGEIGKRVDEHNGPVFKLKINIKFGNGALKIFRIRKPDKERPQKGCGDFKVPDYREFKKKYFGRKNFVFFDYGEFEFLGIHDLTKQYLVYFPDKPITEQLGI